MDHAWFDYPSLGLRDYKLIHAQFVLFLKGLTQCLGNVPELEDTNNVVFCTSPNPVDCGDELDRSAFRQCDGCKPKDGCDPYYRVFSRLEYAPLEEISFTASTRRPSIHLGRNRRPSFKGDVKIDKKKHPFQPSLDTVVGSPRTPRPAFEKGAAARGRTPSEAKLLGLKPNLDGA